MNEICEMESNEIVKLNEIKYVVRAKGKFCFETKNKQMFFLRKKKKS